MRLDKYLKVSRIIKRRSMAKKTCDLGRVSLNGKTAKAMAEVRPGDIIEIRDNAAMYRYKVLSTPEYASEEQAKKMYMTLEDDRP